MLPPRSLLTSLPLRASLVALALALPTLAQDKPARDLHAELGQAAQVALRGSQAAFEAGSARLEEVCAWSVRVLRTEVGKGANAAPAARLAALQRHLDRVQALENDARKRVKLGAASAHEVASAEYYRLQAEQWVANGRMDD